MISPFTPLFFPSSKVDGVSGGGMQVFSTTDRILIEIFYTGGYAAPDKVFKEPEHTQLFSITYRNVNLNLLNGMKFTELCLNPGIYSVQIGGKLSEPFMVTDDPNILDNTTLIQYSNKNNKQRQDALFFIEGMQRFFDFRVFGGFKDNGWTFGVETEQFTNDRSDILQLYALESTQMKFTMGLSEGCPIWLGEHLNRILCCDYVYFDGVRFARKESAVPEITEVQAGVNAFVFSQNLQKVMNIDPTLDAVHEQLLRRVTSDTYRTTNTTTNRLI